MMGQKRLLFILLIVLGLAGLYALWATPRQHRVVVKRSQQSAGAVEKDRGSEPATSRDQRLRVDLLQPSSERYPGFKRDIFGPLFVRPAPKPQPELAPVVPPPPPPPAPPPVIIPVKKDLARFTFLGFLVKEGKRVIFLSKENNLFLVRKGDRFGEDERFVVLDLTPELLTIRQDDDERLISVPLVEKTPLIPSS